METSYCVKDKRQTGFIDEPEIVQLKNNRYALRGRCINCNTMKYTFVSKQNAEGLLSMLGIKTPLAKIPVLGDILF